MDADLIVGITAIELQTLGEYTTLQGLTMTYEEAKAACLNAEDELYDERRYPVLPFVQVASLRYRRTYVVVWDPAIDRWADLYVYQPDSVEKIQNAWEQSSSPARWFVWRRLVEDAHESKNWQVLSLDELIELNRNDWIDIPHCRNWT